MKARFALAIGLLLALARGTAEPVTILRYAHMSSPSSIAGLQAALFADKVREYTKGQVAIEVFPASQFGSLEEQLKAVATGVVAFHHTTAASLGTYYEDFAVLDSPYVYKDVAHLLRVVGPDSPVMKQLAEGLLKAKGLRVVYNFYFGARDLTCDRPILRPQDLSGLKIRSVPFPFFGFVIETLGGVPVPLDWARTPTALAAKALNGQENPVNTILAAKLYESQSCLMLTHHILGAEMVLVNEAVWQKLPKPWREAIMRAGADASWYATSNTRSREESEIRELAARGMKVIGPAEGLDLAAFRERAIRMRTAAYGAQWAEYYRLIDAQR